uniref:Putative secreted protein n=1 Tax=Anopheles darlingi TaxID=43151 RepID=A0A2M4DJ50_ANODA
MVVIVVVLMTSSYVAVVVGGCAPLFTGARLPSSGDLPVHSEVERAPSCDERSAVVVVQCVPRMSGSAFRRPIRPVL